MSFYYISIITINDSWRSLTARKCDANDINFARWWSNAMRHTPTIWVNNFMMLICSIISATCRQSPIAMVGNNSAHTHREFRSEQFYEEMKDDWFPSNIDWWMWRDGRSMRICNVMDAFAVRDLNVSCPISGSNCMLCGNNNSGIHSNSTVNKFNFLVDLAFVS